MADKYDEYLRWCEATGKEPANRQAFEDDQNERANTFLAEWLDKCEPPAEFDVESLYEAYKESCLNHGKLHATPKYFKRRFEEHQNERANTFLAEWLRERDPHFDGAISTRLDSTLPHIVYWDTGGMDWGRLYGMYKDSCLKQGKLCVTYQHFKNGYESRFPRPEPSRVPSGGTKCRLCGRSDPKIDANGLCPWCVPQWWEGGNRAMERLRDHGMLR